MDAKTLAEQHPHMRDADMPIAERIKADIERITDRPGITTNTEAIIAALDHFARCKPARRSKT